MSVNLVALLGNLTRSPELRYARNGAAVCQFGLALNRRDRTAAGAIDEETSFVEVVVWGKQAEIVSAHMTKGRPVFVEGRLQQDTWETVVGERRSRLKVVAERVTFLPRGGATAEGRTAEYEIDTTEEEVTA